MWISKKEYESLCVDMVKREQLEKENAVLKQALDAKKIWEKAYERGVANEELLLELLGRVKKNQDSCITVSGGSIAGSLNINGVDFDKDVAVYIDDYFGGKVIKQESIKVVILDEEGNATYARTSQKNKKDNFQRNYILVEKEG